MRRFLLSLIFVGALSAVFSFSAFAATDYVDSPYMGTGQAVFNHTVSFSVAAEEGDMFYFDVVVRKGYDTILNSSGNNISGLVSNDYYDYSFSVVALGTNYGFGTVQTEGNRVWILADRPVSSITVTFQITISYSWRSGTFIGSPVQDLTQCIARCPFDVTTSNINNNGYGWPTDLGNSDKLDQNSKKLDQILDILGQSPSYNPDFLGSEAILYFDKSYFNNVNTSTGTVSFNSDGIANLTVTSDSAFTLTFFGSYNAVSLQPGEYYFFLSSNISTSYVTDVSFVGYTKGTDYEIVSNTHKSLTSPTRGVASMIRVRVLKPISSYSIYFSFNSAVSGSFYGGITRVSDDVIASDAINPDQDGMVSDVDDAGEQQSQQEDQMWQNINTYKGDISFNLDGWDDAAGGLSYVTGVFMTIWNNSPTQPIVLSLMLGIAMLSIGRGVMAAVRVSRNRGDD